jgi:hypothetical protein
MSPPIPRVPGKRRSVHFSSARADWQTPKWLQQQLDSEFRFDFDPCPHNPTFDGLAVEWGAVNFVNPPVWQGDWKMDQKRMGAMEAG